jgi:hypothetical protein
MPIGKNIRLNHHPFAHHPFYGVRISLFLHSSFDNPPSQTMAVSVSFILKAHGNNEKDGIYARSLRLFYCCPELTILAWVNP